MTDTMTPPRVVHREDLRREAPFRDTSGDGTSDGQTIDGYGAVFDAPTRIDSWEGTFDEVIARGAFKKSIRERKPVMQYDHGRHPLIGSIPLGRWDTVEEDAEGLHVVGRLSDNWLIEPIRDAIRGPDGKGGGITGMSFRFSVIRDEWTDVDGKKIKDDELLDLLWYGAGDRGPLLRTLREVKVSEVGPVAWPAYEQTSVGVRSQATQAMRMRAARVRGSGLVIHLGSIDVASAEGRSALARTVWAADLVAPRVHDVRDDMPEESAADATGAPVSTSGTMPAEPQTTARAADDHPEGPDVTAAAAGEHSSPGSPTPPSPERAAALARLAGIRSRRHREVPLPTGKAS